MVAFATERWPLASLGTSRAGGRALQLWLFWITPIAGAALAGIAHKSLFGDE